MGRSIIDVSRDIAGLETVLLVIWDIAIADRQREGVLSVVKVG
jgi:hypothetical protein